MALQQTGELIRVGVVDDHDLLLAGVRALLSAQNSPARFVAGSDTAEGLLRSGKEFDVVVLDARLSDGSRLEDNIRLLSNKGYPVLIHADHTHREAAPALRRTPARGLVWKTDPALHLLRAIVAVHEGEQWIPADAGDAVDLTHREAEVLKLYASGMKYAETAAALDPPISVESVKTYLSRIRKRYALAGRPASTRMELRQRALEDGLLPPES